MAQRTPYGNSLHSYCQLTIPSSLQQAQHWQQQSRHTFLCQVFPTKPDSQFDENPPYGQSGAGQERRRNSGWRNGSIRTAAPPRRPAALHCPFTFSEWQVAVLSAIIQSSMFDSRRNLAFCSCRVASALQGFLHFAKAQIEPAIKPGRVARVSGGKRWR